MQAVCGPRLQTAVSRGPCYSWLLQPQSCLTEPDIPGLCHLPEGHFQFSAFSNLIGVLVLITSGFPGVSDSKESACNSGDPSWIPGLGRSPRDGHGNPLQYSCLENFTDREAWQATVHGVTKDQTGLSN